jgi:hypothetical protein
MISAVAISLALATPAVEQERCEIRMMAWCIVRGLTRIEMREVSKDSREWNLSIDYLPGGRLTVLEDKGCTFGYTNRMQETARSKGMASDGTPFLEISYSLRDYCSLTFRLPLFTGSRGADPYTLMLTQIRLCTDEACIRPRFVFKDPRATR